LAYDPVAPLWHLPEERARDEGARLWAGVAVRAIRDQDGRLFGFATVIRDITDRLHTADDRREGQRWTASIIEAAVDAIITVDADQRIVQFNRAAEVMFLCAATEALGQTLTQFIPLHPEVAHADHLRIYAAGGVTNRAVGGVHNLSALRSNGAEFPIEASISQAWVDGCLLYTMILRDITQRRRAEERQSLLLQELAHRMKNTLAVVQSVVAQTRRFASPDEFHKTLTGRLTALGEAHDLLATSEWTGATLADVVRFAFEPYDTGGTVRPWTVEGPGIWLASNEAVTLSLVFHELATNAAKYGALSDGKGSVVVQWALTPQGEPAVLTINWRERGGPVVAPPARRGFGSRLLDQAVAHELGGETILTFLPDGAACRLQIPLSTKVALQ
jgi:PAS domain S-box-containing protein